MRTRDVTLETSWPSVYHDLIGDGMAVCRRPVSLRTQTKNAARETEGNMYSPRHPLMRAGMRISYTGQQILQSPSKTVLEVMCNVTGTNFADADYRLPVPSAWESLLFKTLNLIHPNCYNSHAAQKPWMLFRPLIARPEWRGSMARNADPASYHALFNSIREKFFVVSIADLGGVERIVGPDAKADLSFHEGELVFEAIAALAKQSDLVFTSSGFPAILGPAVGTPTISIGGGYEDHRCHDSGAKFAPFLSIGPINPCTCWHSACRNVCDKRIEMFSATAAVNDFVSQTCIQTRDRA